MIENTTIEKYTNKRGRSVYFITPIEGYLLHDNRLDYEDIERGTITKGYTSGSVSVAASYDFNVNPNNIYAILEEVQE